MHGALTAIPLPDRFFDAPIAHRGLHDCGGRFGYGRPENSFASLRSAIGEGYGIEVDIQLTADGVPVVFHDENLKRMIKVDKNVKDLTLTSLKEFRLSNEETIPTFEELLEVVCGRVPILIELKDQDGALGVNTGGIEDKVAVVLDNYIGAVAVMSYNHHSVKRFGLKQPSIPRGLVTEAFKESDWPLLSSEKLLNMRYLTGVEEVAASFISHEYSDLNSKYISQLSKKVKVLSWTVKKKRDFKLAITKSDNVTFEGFMP